MVNKIIFSFLAMMATIAVWGQVIGLTNVTISQKESKTVFIGVDNKFKIDGLENLLKIAPDSSIYILRGDILTLRPNSLGTFSLTFHTKGGPQQVNFNKG